MLTKRQGLTALSMGMLLASALACDALTPDRPPDPTPPGTVAVSTSTGAPTAVEGSPEAPPTQEQRAPADLRLVVAGLDGAAYLADVAGNRYPLGDMQEPLYLYSHHLAADPALGGQAYNVSSAGVLPLPVADDLGLSFAAYVGPAAPNGRVAWDSYTIGDDGTVVGQIHVSSPDGSDARVVLEEGNALAVLRVWRWSADGQQLYFSKEPLGLGGYIPFAGVSNVWALNLADGSPRQIAATLGTSAICIDDLAPAENLLAHHCTPGVIEVGMPGEAPLATIHPPPEAAALLTGDARLSPDNGRVALALALGNPEAEQGWVAVTEGLDDTARLVAKADAGYYFNLVQWLNDASLLLQSQGANPGVYVAQADGSAPALRVADGYVLGVIDNLPGQP